VFFRLLAKNLKSSISMDSTNNSVSQHRLRENENHLVVSYKTLRNLIGYCGMILPVVLILTTRTSFSDINIESSFSDYYYTSSGDVLVAFLCILGAFLFTYKGYNMKENILTSVAGICAVFIAFSPTATDNLKHSFSVHTPIPDVPKIFGIERHTLVAGIFFLILGFVSLCCFTDTEANKRDAQITTRNKKRNNIFKVCGWTMLISVPVMGIYYISDTFSSIAGKIPFIFIMETIATWAFGISWLTIGETFYPDGDHYLVSGYMDIKQCVAGSREPFLRFCSHTGSTKKLSS
jgi:hypothetical protein